MESFIIKFKRRIKKVLTSYRILPQKKHYLEFIVALLTIPTFITLILVNYNNLNPQNKEEEKDQGSLEQVAILPNNASSLTENALVREEEEPTSPPCIEEIGPVEITSPEENEEITESPVFVEVSTDDDYCTQVWSYRINGGKWSGYDDKSIALYDLPDGAITLDLRVKSTVSRDEETLTRSFTYAPSQEAVTPSPTQD